MSTKGVSQIKDGRWIVQYYDSNGNRCKKSFGRGPGAKEEAEAFKLQVDLDKKKGREVRPPSAMHLEDLARLFLADLKVKGRSIAYRKDIALMLQNHVLPLLDHKPVDKLTHHEVTGRVVAYYEARKVCQKTVNRYLTYLKIIFNWGMDHEFINANPLKRWRTPKETKRRVHLDLEGFQQIMRHTAPHLAWALEVQYNLGTRPGPSELFAIKWQDVDFDKERVYVFATKTQEPREIPLRASFVRRLWEMRQRAESDYVIEYKGQPIRKLRRSLQTACRNAGIKYNVRMYDIRHLFASLQLRGGADLAAVSRLLGHKNISTTQEHYYELLRGEKERAVNLLPELVPAQSSEKVVSLGARCA
ncbi:MAG: site-specific integrase [Thermodesulfobacteriota bacterium]